MLKWKFKNELLLLVLWLIVQGFLLTTYGIKTSGEAESVIGNVNNFIANGHFSSPRVYLYFTEFILVYIKTKLALGNVFVVVIHLILNLTATFCLYKFMAAFYASDKLALIGAALIIICYPYQAHNNFLSTESVFFSLSSIYSCYLLQTKKYTLYRTGIICLLLFIICITRPSGFFIVAATLIYFFVITASRFSLTVRIVFFTGFSIIGLVIINYFTKSGNGYDFIIPFKEEHIICGVTSLPGVIEGKMSGQNSLYAFACYLSQHADQFLRLALLKSKAFFGLKRTYFSNGHNMFLMIYFYPLYILAFAAVVKYKRLFANELTYLVAVIFVFWLSIIFTCDDWANRFFLTLAPFFIILALLFFGRKKNLENLSE